MKSSRNKFTILFFLYSLVNMAQVGIGTSTPAATLDITAANLTGTTVDGLLIPRFSRLRAQTMTGTPISTIVYVNDVSNGTAAGTTINVTTVGFYFFTGTVWEKLGSGAVNAWDVAGNSGLSGTANFVGTTDNTDLAFRRNNIASGKIGATSTSFGVNALSAGVATNSVAVGTNALRLTTGADNVAIGNGTLQATTTGIQNTGVGNSALPVNTGSANTAIGFQSLNLNTSGNNGTAVGFQALSKNTTANNNTAVGFQSLTNSTGAENTALGFQSLVNNSTAIRNTGVGFQAAAGFTTGSRNTSVGYSALSGNSTGNENTAVGNFTLGRNTGTGNTAIGHEAEFGSATAFNNTTAIGWHALFNNSASGNTAVGYNALQLNSAATGNTAVGNGSLNNNTGSANTAVGDSAGFERAGGTNNTFIGFQAGRYNPTSPNNNNNTFIGSNAGLYSYGSNNTALGTNALSANAATANNVAIGYNAGSAETGSNKLYIENSNGNANNALIYGEFDTNILRVNGTLQISNPATANGYALPIVRGTNGQVLQTDGAGATAWISPSAMTITETDPQVTSATTTAIPRWNGTTLVDGVIRDDASNVGIGVAPSAANKLDVNGKTRTTNLQMTTGATNGYILQSDAAGNGTWVENPANTLSLVRTHLASNQTLTFPGWQKINFSTEAFDTSNECAAGRFTATKAGFYKINASYHTNNQANTSMYSIGVYVNGAYYQISSYDHSGSGNVERSVSCMVQLAVGGYVEIHAENFNAGVDIDFYDGKTVFEVQQIR